MTLSKNDSILAYEDCRKIMDAAVKHGGLEYICETPQAATRLRQRCYKFRKLEYARIKQNVADLPGAIPSTPYDAFVIRKDKDSRTLLFILEDSAKGQARTLSGEPIELD